MNRNILIPCVSIKSIAWHGLLIILFEYEGDNWDPDIFSTTTSFQRVLKPSKNIVTTFLFKLTDIISKGKTSGAITYREIAKA